MYMRIICPWACASYAMRIRCVCSWACAWNDFKTFYGRYMVHAHVHGTFLWPTCVLHSQQMRITFPCRHSPDVRIGNAMRMRITFPNWRAPRNAHAHSMRRALFSHWVVIITSALTSFPVKLSPKFVKNEYISHPILTKLGMINDKSVDTNP